MVLMTTFCLHSSCCQQNMKLSSVIHDEVMICLNVVFVCLHITSSHCCRHVWRHWTYKTPVMYILSSVCLRLSLFFQSSFMQYMGLCVFTLPFSLVIVMRIYVLDLVVTIKSDVWIISRSVFRVRPRYAPYIFLCSDGNDVHITDPLWEETTGLQRTSLHKAWRFGVCLSSAKKCWTNEQKKNMHDRDLAKFSVSLENAKNSIQMADGFTDCLGDTRTRENKLLSRFKFYIHS